MNSNVNIHRKIAIIRAIITVGMKNRNRNSRKSNGNIPNSSNEREFLGYSDIMGIQGTMMESHMEKDMENRNGNWD